MHPDAPVIHRPGEINAWDNAEFVKAVKDTGRKQRLITGIVTDVCVEFPTLSALEVGYDVYVVVDASCTTNPTVRDASWLRMAQAGAQLINWFNVAAELHRDWRHDVEGLGALFSKYVPNYRALMTSYLSQKR
jgi:nicotinamidase-related amidase